MTEKVRNSVEKSRDCAGLGLLIHSGGRGLGVKSTIGERLVDQPHLFYEFSLERHMPETDLLRSIDRFVELGGFRRELAPFYFTARWGGLRFFIPRSERRFRCGSGSAFRPAVSATPRSDEPVVDDNCGAIG